MADGVARVLTWNLFHGRDHPPERELRTLRSRLLRRTERGAAHAQVNSDLFEQFADVLADAEWDVALLQECPPRWAEELAVRCRADAHRALTARNLPAPLAPLQRLGGRLNPDLLGSWEGGSNLTLVRGAYGAPTIAERRELTLARRPETRRMAYSRLRTGLCIANIHLSQDATAAERELLAAARTAVRWADGRALILGGDFNLRPARSPGAFAALAEEYGFGSPASRQAIDHLLARNLEVVEGPRTWPAARREVPDPTAPRDGPSLPIRLSDHAPVEACFAVPGGAITGKPPL